MEHRLQAVNLQESQVVTYHSVHTDKYAELHYDLTAVQAVYVAPEDHLLLLFTLHVDRFLRMEQPVNNCQGLSQSIRPVRLPGPLVKQEDLTETTYIRQRSRSMLSNHWGAHLSNCSSASCLTVDTCAV
ncbi:unnamed protein product [Pleuronectes platessa]|uniref:Uncharacterized protein n=1 Tax=Pleuronectes platessa TaxID=8262 RepID=A0A9N7V6R3_PLEPL|nr:unnamed protein product [Pleuronectes platessa]